MRTRLVSPGFVAPGRELGRMSDALARAVAGEPSVLLVAGEAKDGRDLGCADDRPRAIPANGSVAGVARRPLERSLRARRAPSVATNAFQAPIGPTPALVANLLAAAARRRSALS